jgi:outer membrane murein-binding lipoprotein Lpp
MSTTVARGNAGKVAGTSDNGLKLDLIAAAISALANALDELEQKIKHLEYEIRRLR